jgi:BirA family biotin operon repressor/biotin-[acetyl-CoA-carboxylase] ligase
MQFPLAQPLAAYFEWIDETGSTNSDLIERAASLPDFSVRVAGFQNAGKGRSGRTWVAPAGSSLFVSVLVKPEALPVSKFSWLPLLAGLAITNVVNSFDPENPATLKWPNDVLVNQQKISGVLSELVSDLSGVVIGAGLNISQQQSELPIENATSLKLQKVETNLDEVLSRYLTELRRLLAAFTEAGGDANKSRLRFEILQHCSTIGSRVKVVLPGDEELFGDAVGIDDTGRLILLPDESTKIVPISAGDIVHLRHN